MPIFLFLGLMIMGLVAGWMAGYVLKNGSPGLERNLVLGLFGSLAAIAFAWVMGFSAIEPALLLVLAFVGAMLVVGAQRLLWPTHIR